MHSSLIYLVLESFFLFTVYTNCDESPCQHNGVCQRHAGSYMCTCMPGYSGYFCQEIDGLQATACIPLLIVVIDSIFIQQLPQQTQQ